MTSRDDSGFLEQLIGVAESGILVVAPDGRVVLSNEAATRLFGLERPPSILPPEGVEFLTPQGLPLDEGRLPWVVAGDVRRPVGERVQMRTATGVVDLRVTVSPLLDDDGEHLGCAVGLCVEPPADFAAEVSRLSQAKRRLEQVLAQMPVGCVLFDARGTVRYENERMVAMRGVPAVSESVEDMVERIEARRPDGSAYEVRDWPGMRALRGEAVQDEEVLMRFPDGTQRHVAMSAAPVWGDDGRIDAAVVVAADVSERRETERLTSAVADVAAAVNSTLEPAEIMSRVVEAAVKAIGADMALLILKDDGGWRVEESLGFERDFTGRSFDAAAAPGVALTYAEDRPILFPDGDGELLTSDRRALHGIGPALCTPVRVRGRPFGVLAFAQRAGSVAFTEAHLAFAEKLSDLVSLALDNASLMAVTREDLARTRVLQEVAAIATSSIELDIVASRVLHALQRGLGMAAGAIGVLAEEADALDIVSIVGLPAKLADGVRRLASVERDWIAAEVVRQESILTHEDSPRMPETVARLLHEGFPGMRVAGVPMFHRRGPVGLLLLGFEGRRPFTEAELELFHAIAHTLGQAVENARLMQGEKKARREAMSELEVSNLLLAAADSLARPMELQEVLERLVESVAHAAERSRAIVVLWQGRGSRPVVRAVTGETRRRPGEEMSPEDTPAALVRALETGTKQLVGALTEGITDDERRSLERNDVRAGLIVPIVYRDRTVGAIMTDTAGSDQPFSERDVRLVEAIAAQAAVVIENAKYYDTQHQIAETLQESMLVMPERIEGIEFTTLYRSATSAARVGGDFYDLFEVAPGRIAIVVGDVSGKGLDAASVTALARDTFRAHAIAGLSPAEVVARTNNALLRFTAPETFVTALFALLDVPSGALVYVNAGHPDGYVIGRSGYVHALGGQSPLLGMLDELPFDERVTVLAPDDTLFLYTDGVTEARRGRELYGSERLTAFLGGLECNDPDLVPQALFAELKEFSAGALRDDVAMLAVRREKEG